MQKLASLHKICVRKDASKWRFYAPLSRPLSDNVTRSFPEQKGGLPCGTKPPPARSVLNSYSALTEHRLQPTNNAACAFTRSLSRLAHVPIDLHTRSHILSSH
ncbi:hypothetical protein Mapa_013041 [Marchantia paleacea]|nr:hypothetical protein Mapa_013041 [Marchantia paleacea]